MVDYKIYKKVLRILEADVRKDFTGGSSERDFLEPTPEDRASAICDLFDTQKVSHINSPIPC